MLLAYWQRLAAHAYPARVEQAPARQAVMGRVGARYIKKVVTISSQPPQ